MNRHPIFLLILCAMTISTSGRVHHVHRISTFGSNVFILETDSSLFLVDAGYPNQEKIILEKIKKLKKPLQLIILTHGHFDHYGSAQKIKDVTGARIGIHEHDAENVCTGTTSSDSVNFIGFMGRLILPLAEKILPPDSICPDILFKDGDRLDEYGIQANIVHTPGHTRGSICILVEDRIAFTGDLIISSPTLHKQCYYANSWSEIDRSIEKLKLQPFTIAYPGHNGKTISREAIRSIQTGTKK